MPEASQLNCSEFVPIWELIICKSNSLQMVELGLLRQVCDTRFDLMLRIGVAEVAGKDLTGHAPLSKTLLKPIARRTKPIHRSRRREA